MNIHVKGIIKKLKSINKEPIFKCSKHFSFHYYDSWPVNVFAVVFICLKKCIGSILIAPLPPHPTHTFSLPTKEIHVHVTKKLKIIPVVMTTYNNEWKDF